MLDTVSQRPTEVFIRNETVLIFLGAGLSKDGDDFGLLQPLTQGAEDVLQLSVQHGAVGLLVVELEDFHEVLEGAAILILLDLRIDGQEFVDLELAFLLHFLHSNLFEDSEGGVAVESPQAIA